MMVLLDVKSNARGMGLGAKHWSLGTTTPRQIWVTQKAPNVERHIFAIILRGTVFTIHGLPKILCLRRMRVNTQRDWCVLRDYPLRMPKVNRNLPQVFHMKSLTSEIDSWGRSWVQSIYDWIAGVSCGVVDNRYDVKKRLSRAGGPMKRNQWYSMMWC